MLIATSGVSDAKCRLFKNLLGKRAVRQACVTNSPNRAVSSPACGVFVSDATPVEVVVEERIVVEEKIVEPTAPMVSAPVPTVSEPFSVPKNTSVFQEPTAPAASVESIIGKDAKQADKDNSPVINFKLK